jgi:hypothetical protein
MSDELLGFVAVDPVRQRLRDLNRSGLTFTQISADTGLSRRYLHQLMAATTLWTTAEVQATIWTIPMPAQPREETWFDHAACRGTPIDLWFPQDRLGRPSHRHKKRTQEIRQLCQTCTVNGPCLDYAIRHQVVGIWAGLDETERKNLKGKQ